MSPVQKKLLILDDDPEILDLLGRILGRKYLLLTRTTTDTFEEDLAEFQPHAVMIDHFIGDKTSKDLMSSTLQDNNIPVILHSAHEDIEKLSIETKVSAFIRKPSSITEIRDMIARVIGDN